MIEQMSVEAFKSIIPTLGERQQLVLDVIIDNPGCCNREIAFLVGLEINKVTPRVFELRSMNLVKSSGWKVDDVSGCRVNTWEEA